MTLSKAQEKRFDEAFKTIFILIDEQFPTGGPATKKQMKQHLSKELALQREKIVEKLKKDFNKNTPYPDHNNAISKDWILNWFDQAIKTINQP